MIELSMNENIINKNSPWKSGWRNKLVSEAEIMRNVKKGIAICPGVLKPNHGLENAKKGDIIAAESLLLDFDKNHGLNFEELREHEFIANNALFAYTTCSHTEEQHRFRVFFKLDRRIDVEDYDKLIRSLIDEFKADKNCKDVSRIFYGNTNAKVMWFGKEFKIAGYKVKENQACKIDRSCCDPSKTDAKWSVDDVKSMLAVIPKQQEYQDWLLVVSGIANEFDHITATELIEEWSPDKDKGTAIKVAHAIPTINMGAVVNMAKKFGWEPKCQPTKEDKTRMERLTADNYYDEFMRIYQYGFENGDHAGVPKLDNLFKFYRKMLTIVSGIPSHGKTAFLKYLMVQLAKNADWRFAVFSPEDSSAAMYMSCLAEIYIGKPFEKGKSNQMTQSDVRQAYDFIREHFYFIFPPNYDHKFSVIIDSVNEIASRKKIDGLIIDPWNQINHSYGEVTEHEYIGKKLNLLKYFSRERDIHTIVVAHPRKPMMDYSDNRKSYKVPSPYDVSGSANWYNVADNFIMVYRPADEQTGTLCNRSTIFVSKVKHRYVGRTGAFTMAFDTNTQRYM
jgi:hypothetical protein